MKLTATAAVVLLGLTGIAGADGPGPCPPVPPKHTPLPPKCDCVGRPGKAGPQGPQGPQGPAGPKGERGNDGVTDVIHHVIEVPADPIPPAIRLGVGVMGTIQAPHGDWAWGPALQIATDVSPRYELALSAGLAMGASDGRETGHLVELKLTRDMGERIGIFGGLHYASIDGSPDNGEIDGSYLGLTAGLSYSGRRVRLAIGPTVGGLRDTFEPGSQLAVGFQASAFVRIP